MDDDLEGPLDYQTREIRREAADLMRATLDAIVRRDVAAAITSHRKLLEDDRDRALASLSHIMAAAADFGVFSQDETGKSGRPPVQRPDEAGLNIATDSSLLKMGRPSLASVWQLPMTTTITHATISVDVLEGISRATGRLRQKRPFPEHRLAAAMRRIVQAPGAPFLVKTNPMRKVAALARQRTGASCVAITARLDPRS